MTYSSESEGRVQVISRATLNQPAVVRIGQQEYWALDHDPNTILVMEDVARELLLRDLPQGIGLTPCKRLILGDDLDDDLEIPMTPSRFDGIAPFRIYHFGAGRAGVVFSWYCTKDTRGELGFHWKLQKAKAVVLARRKNLAGLHFYRILDQGFFAGVEFAATMRCSGLETVMRWAYEVSDDIHAVIKKSVAVPVESYQSESAFVQETFIPLLKKLGFRNVTFHHGPREFGKDVLFSRLMEFEIPEYWAAQVKLGNVSGRSNSYIDLIVSQAQDAFKIPLYDVQTKSKIWISKFVVAITGKFTENAVEKICEKIEIHSQRNNMIFLDGERIRELIEAKKSSELG